MVTTTVQNDYPGAPRITVERYHRMIEHGIIEEGAPVELLDGFLVLKDRSKVGEDPTGIGDEHRWVVQALTKVLAVVRTMGCDLQTQQPIIVPPDSEPE